MSLNRHALTMTYQAAQGNTDFFFFFFCPIFSSQSDKRNPWSILVQYTQLDYTERQKKVTLKYIATPA